MAMKATAADSKQTCGGDAENDSVVVEQLLASGDTTTLFYARQLIGRPYVAHTLEVNDEERLVVNLRQLDCTTLVETVCALTLCARESRKEQLQPEGICKHRYKLEGTCKHHYHSFCNFLQLLRYRQGRIDGYPSRLHYFSDWIDDNVQLGLVQDILSPVDSTLPSPYPTTTLHLNYMSTHPQAYKALRNNPSLVKQIAAQEKRLTGRKCHFIPKDKVKDIKLLKPIIRDGDIIAITCSKPGLDIAHLGFAVWRADGLHLLNASQLHKKVVEEPMTLGEYLGKHPSFTGIRVIRLLP